MNVSMLRLLVSSTLAASLSACVVEPPPATQGSLGDTLRKAPSTSPTASPERPYDPCAGKKSGDLCTLCAPGQPDCFETAVVKYCSASASGQLACSPTPPQPAYDPCAGKKSGDLCTLCAPGQPDCFETAVVKYCSASASGEVRCVPSP